MTTQPRVLVTGVAGRIGTLVREILEPDYVVSGIDLRPVQGIDCLVADMADYDAIRPAFEGIDVVVDLANDPSGALSWERAYANNIPSSYNCLRAAAEAGVGRYVLTSSNRATEGYELDEPYASICRGEYGGLTPSGFKRIDTSMPVRPNGPYGIGKCLAEAAARYFCDYHGLNVICLRPGTVHGGDEPRAVRQFATLLTPRDLQQLYRCAVEAPPDLRFATFYGVSNNTWRFWDIEDAARMIGYQPVDDAEAYRGKVAF
jgi:nucleoside-diphosphate-sugar epimerase